MQKQGTEHEVETGRAERQAERVRHNFRRWGRGQMQQAVIQQRDRGARIQAAQCRRQIAGPSPHIQHGELLLRFHQPIKQASQDAAAA